MAKYTGKDGIVKSGAGSDVVGEFRGFNIEEATEALDASVIDGTNQRGVDAGQKSWTGTVTVLYDPADAGQLNLANGAKVACEFYPIGDAVGKQQLNGNVLITGASIPIEVSGMIEQSITFDGDGALSKSTIS